MPSIRAVLFDFGGTLYDYKTLDSANLKSLQDLLSWCGIEADLSEIRRNYRNSLRRVFRQYLTKPFYMHRDFFHDALIGMLEKFRAHPQVGLSVQWRFKYYFESYNKPEYIETIVDGVKKATESGRWE